MAVSVDPCGSEVLLSPAQVAQICGRSRRAVYDAIGRGELEAFRICARLRISSAALADWLRRSVVPPRPTQPGVASRLPRTVERRGRFKAKLAASAEEARGRGDPRTRSPVTDSNRRPLPYHGSASPAELGGRAGILGFLLRAWVLGPAVFGLYSGSCGLP